MDLILFNTLSREKEKFVPISGAAKLYSCGPTVYSSASIGNMRAYVFVDTLRKVIKLAGFELDDVMNITDVGHLVSDADDGEDKVEKAAKAAGTTPEEIAKRYTDEFFADCVKLNIDVPSVVAPATEHVPQMIEFIKGLEEKGYTYITSDGVYFDSSKFGDYYKLSRQNPEGNKAGARVDLGEKRNANDFALWKLVSPNAMQKWDSPWGVGCPGWHIECSAIALDRFKGTFDIHTGGVDHITIHHTNEIAQTEALTDQPMCRWFMHNEFMTVNGTKMSKSLGNVYTISELEAKGYSPLAFRYLMYQTHYRKQLNFTFEALDSAQTALDKAMVALEKHKNAEDEVPVDALYEKFKKAMLNDMNTSVALAVLWEALKSKPNKAIHRLAVKMDEVLSLGLS